MNQQQRDNVISVHFVYHDNNTVSIYVPINENILQYAHKHNVMIIAKCGGNLSCASCAIYVDEQVFLKNEYIQDISDDELNVIENNDYINHFNTRLCCQLIAHKDIDNIRLHVFETSYGYAH